jgi:hypothetical protein
MRAFQRTIRQRWEPTEPTHSGHLERWLGADIVDHTHRVFKDWYGPPVALHGVPGNVYVTGGGQFVGHIDAGSELSGADVADLIISRNNKIRFGEMAHLRRQSGAFSTLSSLIQAMSGGKGQQLIYVKTGIAANAIGNSNELWTRGSMPAAGAAGAAAPGGTATTNSTTGHFGYANPGTANSGHFMGGQFISSLTNHGLMFIDQLFRVAKTMNSTGTEAVTGTFSRYQSGTATAGDYIGGNFCFPANPTTVLAATAHNWTVCQYTDQGSNTAQSFPSIAGVSACVVGGIDLVAGPGSWFMPLASGDVGVKALSQMQCSAAVATGTIDFVVAHPLGFAPSWLTNVVCYVDTVTTAVDQLKEIYDNACLTAIEPCKVATTAVTFSGLLKTVAE